jgi:L-serine deaminase
MAASTAVSPQPRQQHWEQALYKRYDDAYVVAKNVIRVGSIIKTIGIVGMSISGSAAVIVVVLILTQPRAVPAFFSGADTFLVIIAGVAGLAIGILC